MNEPSRGERRLLLVLGVVLTLGWLWMAWSIAAHFGLTRDGGYYLVSAARINDGWVPYSDWSFGGYTPLAFYLLAVGERIGGLVGGFVVCLTAEALACCGAALIVVKETRRIELGVLAGASMGFSLMYNEGHHIGLEPFVLACAMLACAAAAYRQRASWFFLAGMLSAGAFFSKQFGLAAIAALVMVVLLRWPSRRGLRLAFCAAAGFGLIFAFYLSYFCILHGVDVWQPLGRQVWQPEYATATYVPGVPRSMLKIIYNFYLFLSVHVFLVVFMLFALIRHRWRVGLLLAIAFTALVAPALMIRSYPHYFQLVVPGLFVGGAIAYEELRTSPDRMPMMRWFVLLALLIPVWQGGLSFAWQYKYATQDTAEHRQERQKGLYASIPLNRTQQRQTCAALNEVVPPGTKVLLLASPSYQYLCDFHPFDLIAGYGFPPQLPHMERALAQGEATVIIDRWGGYDFISVKPGLEEKVGPYDTWLKGHGYTMTAEPLQKRFEVWQKL